MDTQAGGLRIIAGRDPFYGFCVKLLAIDYRDGKRCAGRPIVMEEHAPGTIVEPTAILEDAAAQELMDSLWQAGLRPTAGHGSAGQMAATEKHLEDMRRLVFEGGGK